MYYNGTQSLIWASCAQDVIEETPDNGNKCITFNRTPEMSTYLLAIVVGYFDDPVVNKDASDVCISVYTPKGKRNQGEYALEVRWLTVSLSIITLSLISLILVFKGEFYDSHLSIVAEIKSLKERKVSGSYTSGGGLTSSPRHYPSPKLND